jgi:vitamin B12 transporter
VCKNISNILLISSTCLSSFSLYADDQEQKNNLNEVIITANRYSQTVDESLSSVTVITRNDIEKSTAQDLPALLSTVAGFDMRSSGAYGKASSFFMRGTNSSHLLTLVDGVKLYSATAGSTALQHIPLEQIERVEIVRGPRSSVYGAEAIGGVIQIFTRKGHNKPSASANLGLGSNNSKELSASFAGATENANFNLTASSFKTDGIDAIKHTTPNDKDGYNNDSISASIDYQSNPLYSIQSSFMNAQGTNQYDSCFNTTSFATSDDCRSDFVQQTFSNTLNITPEGMWDAKIQLSTSKDLNKNFWESTENGTFQTKRDDAAFINNLQFSETQLLVLGVDYAKDNVETTAYPPTAAPSRNNTGIFAAWNNRFNKLDIELNIRSDNNQQFNRHNTGSIALGHPLSNNIQAFISYGTAFKAPTFNELYFPFFGSETLKPEESNSTEIGIRGKYSTGNWSFNIYQTNIDNLISYDPSVFLANNIDKSQITGAELISAATLFKWNINTSITYTDPVNKSGPNKGKQLVARAKETLSITANRNIGNYTLGMAFLAQGKRYKTADNSVSTAGYGLLDLSTDYNFTSQFKLAVKLNNVLDKDYVLNQTFGGNNYNTLGRNVFFNLVYTM